MLPRQGITLYCILYALGMGTTPNAPVLGTAAVYKPRGAVFLRCKIEESLSYFQHGKAALHLASENGHEEVADLLLMHKAFVNAKSKLGLTPLHLASQNGFNKLVKVLIEKHGASIDALSLVSEEVFHHFVGLFCDLSLASKTTMV